MKKQNCSPGLPKITCKSSFFFFGGGGLRIFLQPPNTHSGVNLAGFLGYAGAHPEGLVGSEGLVVGRMENFEVLACTGVVFVNEIGECHTTVHFSAL